jgi:hypothetical protein
LLIYPKNKNLLPDDSYYMEITGHKQVLIIKLDYKTPAMLERVTDHSGIGVSY